LLPHNDPSIYLALIKVRDLCENEKSLKRRNSTTNQRLLVGTEFHVGQP
jgi:hypothetical protein